MDAQHEAALVAAFGTPVASDEEFSRLSDWLVASLPSDELHQSIIANLMILKRRDARRELSALGLSHVRISTREQQVAFLAETTRAVVRSQAKLD